MSPFYYLILHLRAELQTETVQVVDAAQAWRLGYQCDPHRNSGVVRRDGGRDGELSNRH